MVCSCMMGGQYHIKKLSDIECRREGQDNFEFSNKERNKVLGIIAKGNINLVLLDRCNGNIMWMNCHSILCLIR